MKRKKILIVEDSDNNMNLCIQILENDYELITATNGREGIERALNDNPDLILMDLSLPEVDGWTATQEIKSKKKNLPIVALTAHALAGDEERARKAGCDDYLAKPFLPSQLEEIVKKNME
ncbi:MAG TPA: response regulator [Bdellovibrionota bacterium]|nr:response regulator [Bdellovibrionota bacterium]